LKLNDQYRRLFDDAPPKRVERRKKPDKVILAMRIMAISSWAFLLGGLTLVYFAIPKNIKFFESLIATHIEYPWLPQYLYYSLFLVAPSVIMAVVGLHLNRKRLKRKFDRVSVTVVGALAVSIIVLVSIILNIVLRGF